MNPVITVHQSELYNDTVPTSLQPYLARDQWANICRALRDVRDRATCYSCCGEIICCACTLFVFIFLCHPCIYTCVHQGLMEE